MTRSSGRAATSEERQAALAARGETREGLSAGIWVVSSCRGEEAIRDIVDEPRYELAAQTPAPVGFESLGPICVTARTQR